MPDWLACVERLSYHKYLHLKGYFCFQPPLLEKIYWNVLTIVRCAIHSSDIDAKFHVFTHVLFDVLYSCFLLLTKSNDECLLILF